MTDPLAQLAAARRKEAIPDARPHLWVLIFVILALIAVAVSVLGTEPVVVPVDLTPTPVASRESRIYTVSYRNGVFSPTNLRIHAGDTVRFRNDGNNALRIVADLQPGRRAPEFDSVGSVEPSSYFSYTFATTGEFGYHNNDDGGEAGVILVR